MKNGEKPDAAAIRAHLNALKNAAWLSPAQKWWPSFLFHFTDIRNAVNVLRGNELLSRTRALVSHQMVVNGASPEILERTEERHKDFVRLYFRPRTPTQYRNEGFRPKADRLLGGAHCPVPVYFLFDAESVLCRAQTLFTDGNLAKGATTPRTDADSFRQIPFDLVYHDSWFEPVDRDKIVYHRHAEVLVPQRMDLETLRFIWCRSQAEYETLLYLLPPMTRSRWLKHIGLADSNLFFKHWSFVESAALSSTQARFNFNTSTKTPGPFKIRVELSQIADGAKYVWNDERYMANSTLALDTSKLSNATDYALRLFLEDDLAFAGRYQEEVELPF